MREIDNKKRLKNHGIVSSIQCKIKYATGVPICFFPSSSEALKMLRVALFRRPNLSREKSLAFNLILRASHSTLAYAILTVPPLQSRHKK